MLIVIYILKKKNAWHYMWGYPLSKTRLQKTATDPIETHKLIYINVCKV